MTPMFNDLQYRRVLVTGSLYLAGEVISILRGEREWFQSSTQ